MKSMTYLCSEGTLTYNPQYEGENLATLLTVNFTGAGVDAYTKNVAFITSEGEILLHELGTDIIETMSVPDEWTKLGRGEIQPYAVSGSTIVRFPIKPIRFNRSVGV